MTKNILLVTLTAVTTALLTIIFMIATKDEPVQQTTNIYYTYNIEDKRQYITNNPVIEKKVEVKKPVTPAKPPVKQEPKNTTGYSESDINALAHIINAEANDEPYKGKVAVGNVIINRTKSKEFPHTIKGVIYQPKQFQPVSNGSINKTPSADSIKAAKESLTHNVVGDALYFYNPKIATDDWIRTRQTITTIGGHVFAK